MADTSHDIAITGARVVVEWVDCNGRKQYLPGDRTGLSAGAPPGFQGEVSFDLFFDTLSNTFFCRLHIPFIATLRPKEEIPISLFIPPERVATLDTERPGETLPEYISRQLGEEAIRLQFNLKSPADLIVPQDGSLVPKNKAYGDNLRVMGLLARTTTITLYLAHLSEQQLRTLCNAVSCGTVQSSKEHANLARLYHGRGGRIADASILTQASPPGASDSGRAGPSGTQHGSTSGPSRGVLLAYPAPAYPALQPSAPGYHQYDSPKKRRRPSSTTDVEEEVHVKVLRQLVAEMYGGLGQEVQSIKDNLRATKELHETEELRAIKQEMHKTKEELRAIKQEVRETKEELHEAKEELHEAKEELRAIKQEVRETKEELQVTKQEMHESQRITTQAINLVTEHNSSRVEAIQQRQDGIIETLRAFVDTLVDLTKEGANLLDRVKTEVTRDLVGYIDEEGHAFSLTDDTVEWLIDCVMTGLDVYTKDEVDERLVEVQEHCEGLNNLDVYTKDEVDERLVEVQEHCEGLNNLDIYTRDEVDERLVEVQDHCEGLNNLETEEMVLGAKNELEKDVENEIKNAQLDLRMWVQDRVSRKMMRMAEAMENQVMKVVRMEMRRILQRRRRSRHSIAAFGRKFHRQLKTAFARDLRPGTPPRLQRDTSSTASTASA
ncbi:hypothetical protein VM1G_10074 [Cytospora mali]|uniref:Uncharacterized protein n=1 Tax=Cytospora mali TaxID=578113 RepID=A0A194WDP7_CYTMA|nr:hypothetical protein VM1G_10074 [Valsa mali]